MPLCPHHPKSIFLPSPYICPTRAPPPHISRLVTITLLSCVHRFVCLLLFVFKKSCLSSSQETTLHFLANVSQLPTVIFMESKWASQAFGILSIPSIQKSNQLAIQKAIPAKRFSQQQKAINYDGLSKCAKHWNINSFNPENPMKCHGPFL